ncbi:MAG: hydroxymethylbilane synthase, partial [Bdellovibrio sp.]
MGEAIVKQHRHVEIEYQFKESLGDKNLTDPLWKMPDKGVFTEDFLNDLSEQRCDLVVHSWKDLPVEDNPRTEIAATVEREDVRDLLLFKKGSREKLGQGSSLHILSSSPRRMYNLPEFLRQYLPATTGHIQFHPVRGNIPTRMRKLLSQPEVDGLVLAKAGLDRLLGADRLPQRAEFAEVRNFLRSALRECD